ncbi:MAG: hypothetical protein IAG13_38420 [Deltaproteobacteria bacterium]|nr:hypothetical protein [Nannocystaceae bacterium]
MIIFEIALNDEPLCRAGVGPTGVVTTIVTWFGPKDEERARRPETLDLHVGGMPGAGSEHLKWFDGPLKVGDRVTITIVDGGDPEEPRQRKIVEQAEPPDPADGRNLRVLKRAGVDR